ncbi:MAG: 4-carboxy-2-hydroxymuconate-6-semialdehyde dehydrogenase [Pelotomaculum sp. PtaB.Bin104]|nr:MAG: 4-carboxy-2-hydroxymuconate-6-semialdehyde dehydrogenase [Pelotomaculum sp. PtaB.Bin104]
MKQVLIKQGQAIVEEIPAPQVEPGTILVQVDHSCISIGTEISGIKASGLPLWKRAFKQPENVKKVIQFVATQGITKTRSLVKGKLSSGNPTGYSAAGIVLEVGESIDDLRPGDLVACAGAQCAHHAEIIRVPRNLTVPVPDKLDLDVASTVTLGAIALQGVRRAQPTLGETFMVIGLGILGQFTVQLLRANGCRVIGTDLDSERIHLALDMGMNKGVFPEDGNDIEHVMRLTDGIGADGVIITAATSSDMVVSTAFKMCRKKGRVVLVGDVGLNLNRADFYQKELDFFISSSYGPGRYDNNYEEKGLDYPAAYVRWTENRNMAEYLRLVAEGNIKVKPLISAIYPIEQATAAYDSFKNDTAKPLMVLLSYPKIKESTENVRVITNSFTRSSGSGQIRVAVVGAGGFAKGMHLPNLQELSDRFCLHAIVSRTGHNATATAKQFGANYATTDYEQVLNDPEVDAVLIATRHNLHASMVLKALKAGKHVLVEKPLALTQEELNYIKDFYASASFSDSLPVLLTGFNRRFSRYAISIYDFIKRRSNPMILNYRMNAGYIPLDHWVHTEEGGGRNRGEACHIYDLFTYFTGAKVVTVNAQAITPSTGYYSYSDNFVATMTFEDGSVATLTYTALGTSEYPKEQMEVFVDGKVLVLNDFKRLNVVGAKVKGLESKSPDKGQKEELVEFARAIKQGSEWPIPLWQQIQATEIALLVEDHLRSVH